MTLSGWTSSTNIQLYSTVALTNYQVKFVIHRTTGTNTADDIYIGANCETDYKDIRFTSTSDVVYSYWIESSDSSSATIWVKIPSISANAYTNIVLQYGNSGASAVSSGDDTFDFFDDFNSGTLDTTTNWTVVRGQSYSVTDGILTVSGANDAADNIQSKTSFATGYALRMSSRWNNTLGSSFFGFHDMNNDGVAFWDSAGYAAAAQKSGTGTQTGTPTSGSTLLTYEIQRISSTSTKLYRSGTLLLDVTSSSYITTTARPIVLRQYGTGYSQGHDWILIRQISAVEPTKYYPQPLSDWSYKRSHAITSATTLTDYQVKITVNYGSTPEPQTGDTIYLDGKCRADFGDIRFTNNDNEELPYWIESSTAGSIATFWVKVDTLPSTIWLYYGNETASTTSNGDTTFDFFDDFTGTSLNTSKWNSTLIAYNGGTGTAVVNEALTLTQTKSGPEYGTSISSLNPLASNQYTIRTKVNARSTGSASTAQLRLVLNTSSSEGPGSFGMSWNANGNRVYLHNGLGVSNPYTTDTFSTTTAAIYECKMNVDNPTLKKNDSIILTGTGNPTDPPGNYIRIWCYATNTSITLDWIAAKAYAAPEPTQSTWSDEYVNMGILVRIIQKNITGSGNLIVQEVMLR